MAFRNMPLSGIKVVELAGLAPAPYCGRILSDWGASVIRVDKPYAVDIDRLSGNKRSIIVNNKRAEGKEIIRTLCKSSDVLIDPFRPGVLERLGLGPETLMADNPGLVYTRITGYGQTGPFSKRAGHDINYVSMSGILSSLGRKDEVPTPPINLLADFAGGGMNAAFGVAMALLQRHGNGLGQVVDCSMTEGAAYVGSWLYHMRDVAPIFGAPRGSNMLDTGTHFYDTYETKDGRHMAVGAVEPQFYAILVDKLGLDLDEVPQFEDFESSKKIFQEKFKSKTFQQWCEVFADCDACVTPVLSMDEASHHEHSEARGSHVAAPTFAGKRDKGRRVPAPSPRLSGCPAVSGHERSFYPRMGEHTHQILSEIGCSEDKIQSLLSEEIVQASEDLSSKL